MRRTTQKPLPSPKLTGRKLVRKRVARLKPSPENEKLYHAVDRYNAEIIKLANSIHKYGLREHLDITEDDYIVSGHRRHMALQFLGQAWVTCRVLPVRRSAMDPDAYLALIREYNRQRSKSVAEQVREELLDINPDVAHAELVKLRDRSTYAAEMNGVPALTIEGTKKRWDISEDKQEHVRHIQKVLEGRREYWPLTVRGVHYPLLNFDFVRGYYWPKKHEPDYGKRLELRYLNDRGSYQATSELLTRLRLAGVVP